MPAHGRQVALRAAGDKADAGAGVRPGRRPQLIAQAGQQPPDRGPDLLSDDAAGLAADRRLIDVAGQGHRDQRVGVEVLAEVTCQLRGGLPYPGLGREPPVALSLAVAAGDGVEVAAQPAEPPQVTVHGAGVAEQRGRNGLEDHGLGGDIAGR